VQWEAGRWIEIEISDIALLEEVRGADSPILTLGLWGTDGYGLYGISSRESGYAPELTLVTEDAQKKRDPAGRMPRYPRF
jgi:hypothetical protein